MVKFLNQQIQKWNLSFNAKGKEDFSSGGSKREGESKKRAAEEHHSLAATPSDGRKWRVKQSSYGLAAEGVEKRRKRQKEDQGKMTATYAFRRVYINQEKRPILEIARDYPCLFDQEEVRILIFILIVNYQSL